MSGEHRYRSAPASEEYRENFDRIFRGKVKRQMVCAPPSEAASTYARSFPFVDCGYDLAEQTDGKACARIMNQAFGEKVS